MKILPSHKFQTITQPISLSRVHTHTHIYVYIYIYHGLQLFTPFCSLLLIFTTKVLGYWIFFWRNILYIYIYIYIYSYIYILEQSLLTHISWPFWLPVPGVRSVTMGLLLSSSESAQHKKTNNIYTEIFIIHRVVCPVPVHRASLRLLGT